MELYGIVNAPQTHYRNRPLAKSDCERMPQVSRKRHAFAVKETYMIQPSRSVWVDVCVERGGERGEDTRCPSTGLNQHRVTQLAKSLQGWISPSIETKVHLIPWHCSKNSCHGIAMRYVMWLFQYTDGGTPQATVIAGMKHTAFHVQYCKMPCTGMAVVLEKG